MTKPPFLPAGVASLAPHSDACKLDIVINVGVDEESDVDDEDVDEDEEGFLVRVKDCIFERDTTGMVHTSKHSIIALLSRTKSSLQRFRRVSLQKLSDERFSVQIQNLF